MSISCIHTLRVFSSIPKMLARTETGICLPFWKASWRTLGSMCFLGWPHFPVCFVWICQGVVNSVSDLKWFHLKLNLAMMLESWYTLIFCWHPLFINKLQQCCEFSSHLLNPFQGYQFSLCWLCQQQNKGKCIKSDHISILLEPMNLYASYVDVRWSCLVNLV